MQLGTKTLAGLVAVLAGLGAGGTMAQSLSPMQKTGTTPSDVKGFKLLVGNPYAQRMSFLIVPMDPKFETEAGKAVVSPPEVRLAPGYARTVTVQFKIDPEAKERTIGVCVLPKALDGPIQPRVCGTYTGVRLGTGG